MTGDRLPCSLLAVTDRTQSHFALDEQVAGLLSGGARWLWFREKDLPRPERRELATRLLTMVRIAGGRLTLGGDMELACEIGADAVHLSTPADARLARRRLGATALVGVSAHRLEDVAEALIAGANYVTLSPIFLTSSKPGYGPALGLSALMDSARMNIHVLALGGVEAQSIAAVKSAGAAGVAVMGALMRASRPAECAAAMLRAWEA